MGRQIPWVYLACVTLPAIFLARLLPNDKEYGVQGGKRIDGGDGNEEVPLVEAETTATDWHEEIGDMERR